MNTSAGLTPVKLAASLSRASGLPVTPAMIEADVAAGAPTNPDGSVHILRYVAWLLKNGNSGPN